MTMVNLEEWSGAWNETSSVAPIYFITTCDANVMDTTTKIER